MCYITMSIISAVQSAKAAQANANAQAQAMRFNAKLAEDQKAQVEEQKRDEQSRIAEQARQQTETGIASFGGQGINLSSHNVGQFLFSSHDARNKDLNAADYNARMKQWGLSNEAKQSRYQADVALAQGDAAAASSYMQIPGGVMSGIGSWLSLAGGIKELGGISGIKSSAKSGFNSLNFWS